MFSRDLITDRRQLMLYGLCLLFTILASELGFLQRLLDTVPLTGGQWIVCIVPALLLIAIDECRDLLRRRVPQ